VKLDCRRSVLGRFESSEKEKVEYEYDLSLQAYTKPVLNIVHGPCSERIAPPKLRCSPVLAARRSISIGNRHR
jgi:hypothetical protein